MFTRLLVPLAGVLCTLVATVSAKIGETRAQIEARLGPPATQEGDVTQYTKEGYRVGVVYRDNVSVAEAVLKEEGTPFGESELAGVMAAYADAATWNKDATAGVWVRSDGKVIAAREGNKLLFTNAEYARSLVSQADAAQKSQIDAVFGPALTPAEKRRAAYIHDHFAELVQVSQARAIGKHPDLAVAGSEFNRQFVAHYQDLRTKGDPLLNDPCWPERMVGDAPPGLIVPPSFEASVVPPGQSTPAAVWNTPQPPYPTQARLAHVQGTTTVHVTTDASGNISSVEIVKSAGSAILDSNTQSYVKMNWKGPPNTTCDTAFEYQLQ